MFVYYDFDNCELWLLTELYDYHYHYHNKGDLSGAVYVVAPEFPDVTGNHDAERFGFAEGLGCGAARPLSKPGA